MLARLSLVLMLFVAACGEITVTTPSSPTSAPERSGPTAQVQRREAGPAPRDFVRVVNDVLPVAIRECRRRTDNVRCDYAVVVDDRPNVPPNAFYTLSPEGQPVVGFTLPLIRLARNRDELAFVLGHEAAHHIAGHIPRGQASAASSATLAGALVALGGGSEASIRQAQNVGAFYGARRYAQDFELEADALGTILTARAGYDPLAGVAFFQNSPDPGNTFLGTHPPNARRIDIVRRTMAQIR